MKSSDTKWHVGSICLEVKLHPRHIGNYAMICMKYRNNQKNKTDIIINYGRENYTYKSQVLPFNKNIYVGLNKEFAEAIYEFFIENYDEKLPCGTIDILTGGFDEAGSNNESFKKVMTLLVFIFKHIDDMGDDELQCELLKMLQNY